MDILDHAIDWVIACVSPHTIAPHPNFSQSSVGSSALVGLLASGQLTEYLLHRENDDSLGGLQDIGLVEDIFDSLKDDTQAAACEKLIETATRVGPRVGTRAAAALFASVGLAEMDDAERAAQVLESTQSALDDLEHAPPLAAAALRQQHALRLLEVGDRDGARDASEAVLRLMDDLPAQWEAFPTSRGFSGGPRRAYREAASTLASHARSCLASLEPIPGRSWVSIVRSRPTWSDQRAHAAAGSAGTAFVRRQFEQSVGWSSGRIRHYMTDPIDGGASAALLHAELTGDVGAVADRRVLLGRARFLNARDDRTFATREGLRLLRQGDARDDLRDAIRSVRGEGPVRELKDAAEDAVRRGIRGRSLTDCDRLLVRESADLLDEGLLQDSIELMIRASDIHFPSRIRRQTRAAVAFWRDAWMSIARLLPTSGHDSFAAEQLLPVLQEFGSDLQLLTSAAIQVIDTVNWTAVDRSTVDSWRTAVSDLSGSESSAVAAAVLDALDGVGRHEKSGIPRPTGLDLAARVVWELANDVQVPKQELELSMRECIEDVRATISRADGGVFTMGGYSGADIGVAMSMYYDSGDLWDSIGELLSNDRVADHDKAPVFERLAQFPERMPSSLVRTMAVDIQKCVRPGHNPGIMNDAPLPVFGPGLRFGLAHGLLSANDALRFVSLLTSHSSPAARLEGARSLSVLSRRAPLADWASALLVQLSSDREAHVRAEAGRSLSALLSGHFRGLAEERVRTLLLSDGVVVPLSTVRGLAASRDLSSELLEVLRSLAVGHVSRGVRVEARAALAAQGLPT